MTDASSKIDVRRLSTLCITVSSIPCSRSVLISVPVTWQRCHLEWVQCVLTRFPEVFNVSIPQECIAKNASGIAMRMNKP